MLNKLKEIFLERSLKGNIVRGLLWSFLGTIISKGLLLISFILVARLLDVDNYGRLGIIRSTITTFSFFSIASFGITATKYLAFYSDQKDIEKLQRIISLVRVFVLFLSVLISITVYIFSFQIAEHFLNDKSLELGIKISSVTIFFTSLNGLQTGILSGLEKFKYISLINVSNGLLSFPLLLILSYYYGLYGAIVAICITQFLLWIVSYYYVKKSLKEFGIPLKFKNFKSELSIIKEFTLPSFLSGLIIPPIIWVSDLIIINSEHGYKDMGIYAAAYNFSVITLTLNNIIGQVLYPYIMKNVSDKNDNLEFFNQVFPFFMGIILNLPLLILPHIFSLTFGNEYAGDQLNFSIVIISLSTIIICHRQGISRNFASGNYMWWSVLGNSFWGIAAVFFVYYYDHLGAIGRALGFLIAYGLNTLFFIPLYIKKKLIQKDVLINKYALAIWIIVFCCFAINLLTVHNLIKILICLLSISIVTFLFYIWYRKKSVHV